jgi:uncharacterized protein (DUF849 family)
VLIEPMDPIVAAALRTARDIRAVLDDAGMALPRLLHGEGRPAWGVLDVAAADGLDVRIGLEDTLDDRAGARASGNAALVRAARSVLGS